MSLNNVKPGENKKSSDHKNTEGRGFESHLELGFFSESPLDAKTSCCMTTKMK